MKIRFIALGLLMAALLSGCNSDAPADASETTAAAETQAPVSDLILVGEGAALFDPLDHLVPIGDVFLAVGNGVFFCCWPLFGNIEGHTEADVGDKHHDDGQGRKDGKSDPKVVHENILLF